MPPRQPIPADDLYARLEISIDASSEAIEVAWRALLRRHHPDIAGPSGLERSKRINVAHDWLSDLDLRTRYDHERGIRRSVRDTAGRDPRRSGHGEAGGPGGPGAPGGPGGPGGPGAPGGPGSPGGPGASSAVRRRPLDPAEALALFLERVGLLEADEIDRLACAEPPPIAFGATIARFLPPDRLAALEAMEGAVDARLDPVAAGRPGVRDAVEGYGTELVLGSFLDDLLSEPFRERTRERLTRGWESAVGQPRYGPNGDAVRALIGRLTDLDAAGVTALARVAELIRREGQTDDPWPPGASPDDDEALRVSSVLAARDASASIPAGLTDRVTLGRARRSAQRLAHLVVLRTAFAPAAFDSLTRPWRPRFFPDDRPGPQVRHRFRRD